MRSRLARTAHRVGVPEEAYLKKLLVVSMLMVASVAAAETCRLQTYASSWMATGTPFSVVCPSGVYTGVLVATPARRFFRRGHLMLKFSQPVAVVSKNPKDEGKIESGRGRQIVNLLLDGGAGIGAKDITDGLSGAIYKSWYAIPISGVALAFFSNGGDVNLKPGYALEVQTLRNTAQGGARSGEAAAVSSQRSAGNRP